MVSRLAGYMIWIFGNKVGSGFDGLRIDTEGGGKGLRLTSLVSEAAGFLHLRGCKVH